MNFRRSHLDRLAIYAIDIVTNSLFFYLPRRNSVFKEFFSVFELTLKSEKAGTFFFMLILSLSAQWLIAMLHSEFNLQ